jgi:hypothetical protein
MTIALSFSDFKRLTSVWGLRELEAAFIFGCLANRNDVIVIVIAIATRRMGYRDDDAVQQSQPAYGALHFFLTPTRSAPSFLRSPILGEV